MSDIILLVFEGRRTEPKIFENLKKEFFENESKTIVQAVYGTDIYQLWKAIEKDKYLDLIELLREWNTHGISPSTSKKRNR